MPTSQRCRYNFFKGITLVLLAALPGLWGCTRQAGSVQTPALSSPEAVVAPSAEPTVSEPIVYKAPTLTLPTGEPDKAAVPFSGTGTPGSTVELFNNGESLGTAVVDSNGQWSLTVPVNHYVNDLQAFGFDPDGTSIGDSGVQQLLLPAAAASLTLSASDLEEFTPGDAGLPQSTIHLMGTGEPFTRVRLTLGSLDLGTVDIDADGNWSFDGEFALEPGSYDLKAQMISADNEELGLAEVAGLVVPELAVGQPVIIDAVEVVDAGDNTGEVTLRGTAVPGSQIQILIDEEAVGAVVADAEGSWTYTTTLSTGSYVVNGRYLDVSETEADQLAAATTVMVGQPTGSLQILFASGSRAGQPGLAPTGSPAVELILDASWSMMERLGNTTRFEAARTALQNITDSVLPNGTPIAVRVFGNIEGNYSCRTDLMVPYQPLDRAAMNTFLADVEPQFNANTPIAASLAHVTTDLADAGELNRIIVLLTDGAETCDGDPAAEIQKLRDLGIGVQVNIIGLDIAERRVKADFERWAEIGGGHYFDVTNPDRLAEALSEALLIPYVVRNEAGEVVATGRVGGSNLMLPVGIYDIEVSTVPAVIFESVEIVERERVQLTLDE